MEEQYKSRNRETRACSRAYGAAYVAAARGYNAVEVSNVRACMSLYLSYYLEAGQALEVPTAVTLQPS